jgi:hypothetical protein
MELSALRRAWPAATLFFSARLASIYFGLRVGSSWAGAPQNVRRCALPPGMALPIPTPPFPRFLSRTNNHTCIVPAPPQTGQNGQSGVSFPHFTS